MATGIYKEAAEAIRNLLAERDVLKMHLEKTAKQRQILNKLVESGTIKTAEEVLAMQKTLETSQDEDAVEKALDLFPERVSGGEHFGKVADERDSGGLTAAERFASFLAS